MRKVLFLDRFARYKYQVIRMLGYVCIMAAILNGVLTRIITVFSNGEFRGDQVRDAYVYIDMWHGILPTLGASSSVGGYALPPLYYYIVFPFTAAGFDPVWQALPNAIFSFASIPLLMVVVYTFLTNVPSPKRFFLAAVAGLWWSASFSDMSLAIKEWNPSPIPFFLLLFLLIAHAVLEKRKNKGHTALLWVAYGLVIAILVSLHSSAWLIMPIVAVVHSIAAAIKTKQWYWPLLGLSLALLALWPYWSGEIARGWTNTQLLVETVRAPSEQPHTFVEYAEHSAESYAQLGKLAYFPGQSAPYLASMFVYMAFAFFLAYFRGNKRLFLIFVPIWVLYAYSTAHYWGPLFIHYQLLLIFAPIFFTIGTLGYLSIHRKRHLLIMTFFAIGMVCSFYANAINQKQFLADNFGKDRIMNTGDIQQAFQNIPPEATICGEKETLSVYEYIDTTLSKQNLKISTECAKGMYMVFPHFSKWHNERDYLRSLMPKKYQEIESNTIFTIYYFQS